MKNVPADLADDEWALERLTLRILASLQRGESKHQLTTDPSAAFVALAEAMWSLLNHLGWFTYVLPIG